MLLCRSRDESAGNRPQHARIQQQPPAMAVILGHLLDHRLHPRERVRMFLGLQRVVVPNSLYVSCPKLRPTHLTPVCRHQHPAFHRHILWLEGLQAHQNMEARGDGLPHGHPDARGDRNTRGSAHNLRREALRYSLLVAPLSIETRHVSSAACLTCICDVVPTHAPPSSRACLCATLLYSTVPRSRNSHPFHVLVRGARVHARPVVLAFGHHPSLCSCYRMYPLPP